MSRTAKNKLTIEPIAGGSFRLFGYCNGKNVRLKSASVAELQKKKADLENDLATLQGLAKDEQARKTHLTAEQLLDAEAAFRLLIGKRHSLVECVNAGMASLGDGKPVAVLEALEAWKAKQVQLRKSMTTINSNQAIMRRFLKFTHAATVGEITSNEIDKFVYHGKIAASTQISRACTVRAFLNFCMRKPQQFIRVSPFSTEIAELKDIAAREAVRPAILTPTQCESLLDVSLAYKGGRFAPYTVLALFCFMRSAEAQRTTLENFRLNGKNLVEVWPRKRGTVSYRAVTIPENVLPIIKNAIASGIIKSGEPIPFASRDWDRIRELAGIITCGERTSKTCWRKKIIGGVWNANILRHTGISYLFQKSGDSKDVTRQAGNSVEVAFARYVNLPEEGAADAFYSITGSLKPVLQAKFA